MVYITLFFIFLKIGMFSFGGGLAMLPIIEREVVNHNWLTVEEFMKIVSISQMTPGPIAVNTATFVGNKAGGVFGAMIATIGLTLPSVVLMLLISSFILKVQNHPLKISFFTGIKAVSISLILFAAFNLGGNIFFVDNSTKIIPIIFTGIFYLIINKSRLHPLVIIALAGSIGYFIF